jgi:uncharacterized damage-inducible protein DinB
MLGKTMLGSMLAYHRIANERILDQAAKLDTAALNEPIDGIGGRSVLDTLRHAADTDLSWRSFSETHQPYTEDDGPVQRLQTVPKIAAYQAEETARLSAWLDRQTEAELMQEIEVTWQDETSRITPWHGLLQMLLHGQHHRTELAMALTRHGHSPNDLDYIMYV